MDEITKKSEKWTNDAKEWWYDAESYRPRSQNKYEWQKWLNKTYDTSDRIPGDDARTRRDLDEGISSAMMLASSNTDGAIQYPNSFAYGEWPEWFNEQSDCMRYVQCKDPANNKNHQVVAEEIAGCKNSKPGTLYRFVHTFASPIMRRNKAWELCFGRSAPEPPGSQSVTDQDVISYLLSERKLHALFVTFDIPVCDRNDWYPIFRDWFDVLECARGGVSPMEVRRRLIQLRITLTKGYYGCNTRDRVRSVPDCSSFKAFIWETTSSIRRNWSLEPENQSVGDRFLVPSVTYSIEYPDDNAWFNETVDGFEGKTWTCQPDGTRPRSSNKPGNKRRMFGRVDNETLIKRQK